MKRMIVLVLYGFLLFAACRKSEFPIEQEIISDPGPVTCATNVTTYAGSVTPGYQNGSLLSARFKNPLGIVVNPSLPSELFVSDGNQIIRRLNETNVNLFAGVPAVSGHIDGPATTARFRTPREMAMDQLGNVYVADFYNFCIRKISSTGVVTTIAGVSGERGYMDGPGSTALFKSLHGIDISNDGKDLYVADYENHLIRKIDLQTNRVSTFAGGTDGGYVNGTTSDARFAFPSDVACAPDGSIYVADEVNNCIRKISSGMVTTFAGQTGATGTGAGFVNGPSFNARFRSPRTLDVDDFGNVYVCDYGNYAIRKIAPGTGTIYAFVVSTVAGTGFKGFRNGSAAVAQFSAPLDLSVNYDGSKIYVVDYDVHQIRVITRTCVSL